MSLISRARVVFVSSAVIILASGCFQKVSLAPIDERIEQAAAIQARVPEVPILTYHRITDTVKNGMALSPARFRTQLTYLLKNGYTPITPDQWSRGVVYGTELPDKPVILTFDDGWKSQYQNAVPILKELHIPATFYIYPDVIGNNSSMSWKEVRELAQQNFTIGSHSQSHPKLPQRFSFEDEKRYSRRLTREIEDSKRLIEEHIGKPVLHFCYPYGYYNTNIIEFVRRARYVTAVTVNPAVNGRDTSLFSMGRMIIGSDTTTEEIQKYLDSRVLNVKELMPADGIIRRNITPALQARIVPSGTDRFTRVQVKWNWKWKESEWNERTQTLRCRLDQPLKQGSYSAQIHAWDGKSNHFVYAWQFQQDSIETVKNEETRRIQ